MPLLEIAIPYDTISKIPNGVKKIIKGFEYDATAPPDASNNELNTKPVEKPEIVPIAIPIIGINITNAIFRLLKKISILSKEPN